MLDVEKLLGGLISSGLGRRGLDIPGLGSTGANSSGLGSPSSKAGLGMGLLGVAIAAFEHYTGDDRKDMAGKSVSAPQVSGITPPPPPPSGSSPVVAPPPPPPAQAAPANASPVATDAKQAEARLCLRAMISAAASDGQIDPDERAKILDRLESIGLNNQERQFILAEMDRPVTLDELVAGVEGREQALKLYLSSLLAIEVDTAVERDYLRTLAARLQLPTETLEAIHQRYQVAI